MTALPPFPEPPRIPPGITLTAIGDVHGHLDLLEPYLEEAEARAARRPHRQHMVIVLGDIIDRGPRSAEVVERLSQGLPGCELIVLRGNHEEAMLDFLAGESSGRQWLGFGGRETVRSYGLDASQIGAGHQGLDSLRHELLATLPRGHLEFLQALPLSVMLGDYLFVHAGVRPGRSIEAQTDRDLVWIRDEFLQVTTRFEKKIVHGHTPAAEPEILDNRINLDTGAYATGRLTAAVFEDDHLTLL